MHTPEPPFLSQLRATFRVEAADHLQVLSAGLLALEKERDGQARRALIETVFREAHSLKGAARAVDYAEVERLCQAMEETFAGWRRGPDGPDGPTAEVLDGLHRSLDEIVAAVAATARPAATKAPMASMPAQREAAPAPAAEAPADATVRVAMGKLQSCLVHAEEMLGAKLMTAQRAAEVRELSVALAGWDSAWNAVQPQLGSARRARPAGFDADLDKLLDFLDWNAACVKEAARRAAALERQLRQDRHAVDRLVDDLLEESKLLLLLPFSSITGSFERLVRDLCREQGKQAVLRIEGDDAELDKRILEEIKDPLIHLLRNCVDHGIEPPAERRRRGKPEQAAIAVRVAQLSSGKVEITVADDGAGIDAARVARAAVDKGLLSPDDAARISDEAARELVFVSEVSTSPAVTRVSGRGLGLAIVREKAEHLGGSVTVTSDAGHGTAFRITVPATQATFRGILVMAAGQLLVVPTLHVERVVRVRPQEVRSVEGREMVSLGGRAVALVRLAEVLELPAVPVAQPQASGVPVLVLGSGEQCVGFAVDRVVDEQEVLVKRLGAPLLRVRNVSGATVLGSGRVAPVLDVADLLRSARKAGAALRFTLPEPPRHKADVLLAEDSITSRLMLKGILEAAGYRVKTAADGVEALNLLHRDHFDALVSDVEMPGLNGMALTERVRTDQRLKDLPVVLVTALESQADREQGLEVGADAYIVKSSFDQSELVATLGRLV